MSTTIILTIEDDMPAGDAHLKVITAIEHAGFRSWSSRVELDAIPDPSQYGFP